MSVIVRGVNDVTSGPPTGDAEIICPGDGFYNTALFGTSLRGAGRYMYDGASVFGRGGAVDMSGKKSGTIVLVDAPAAEYNRYYLESRDARVHVPGDQRVLQYVQDPENPENYILMQVLQEDLTTAVSGHITLEARREDIAYRTDATTFVQVLLTNPGLAARSTRAVTLKCVYVPRAGRYRAHFGAMKEFYYVANSSGTPFCYLDVFGQHMDECVPITVLYSTDAEKAAGGGNPDRNEWYDYFLDFETSREGLVEMRYLSLPTGAGPQILFDTLEIYARV